jgi:hypothetical protein
MAAKHVGAATLRFDERRTVDRSQQPERGIECAGVKIRLCGA